MSEQNKGHRVVITGMGAITPLGNTVDEYWQNLVKGESGIGWITVIGGRVHGLDLFGSNALAVVHFPAMLLIAFGAILLIAFQQFNELTPG